MVEIHNYIVTFLTPKCNLCNLGDNLGASPLNSPNITVLYSHNNIARVEIACAISTPRHTHTPPNAPAREMRTTSPAHKSVRTTGIPNNMRVPSTKAVALLLAACRSSRSAQASYHLDETYVGTSTPTVFPMGPTSPAPESAAPAAAGAPDDSSATQLTCPDTLDQSAIIDSGATLYYAVVPSDPAGSGNGLLCGRLEVEDQDGWIGMGFSADGLMTGSQAIIGIPADGTVLKYDLTYTAAPMSDDRQTLTGTSIAEADGRVIMEFAKLLVEEGEVAILEGVENRFIHARGPSELGYHTNGRTSASVVLATTAGDQDSASLPPAPTPDASAVIEFTEGAKDCTKEMCEYQLADNFLLKYQVNVPSDTTLEVCEKCTISMEAIYDGEAWVAIAFSTDGSMIGSESVM